MQQGLVLVLVGLCGCAAAAAAASVSVPAEGRDPAFLRRYFSPRLTGFFDDDDDDDEDPFAHDNDTVRFCNGTYDREMYGSMRFTRDPPFEDWMLPDCGETVAPTVRLYLPGYDSFAAERNNYLGGRYCQLYGSGFRDGNRCFRHLAANAASVDKYVFIVHGFLTERVQQWQVDMARGIMNKESRTAVLVVSYDGLSSPAFYAEARANTRYVAAVIERTVEEIRTVSRITSDDDTPYDALPKFHCVGHSLGAHICGLAGKPLSTAGRPLDRITGLDPAGPGFASDTVPSWIYGRWNGTADSRLNGTDAVVVDVIHTYGVQIPAGILVPQFGTMEPRGTVDFYAGTGPYYGYRQPGCVDSPAVNACSHLRAVQLFLASVLEGNAPCGADMRCDAQPLPLAAANCTAVPRDSAAPVMGYFLDNYQPGIYTVDYRNWFGDYCGKKH